MSLLEAIKNVERLSANNVGPEDGPLLDRVNRYIAACDELEKVLAYELSEAERVRLLRVLLDMHRDPLDKEQGIWLDAFIEEVA